ncbi:MAG: site-2 protease family protein [Bacillota bacterium]|nr:site-2 protease family protein [Bacillota bacterium]
MDQLQRYLAYPLRDIPYVAITLMIAFTVHEFSHAYVAYKFGDPTAKKQGRLTLNPFQHLDPIGTLLIFIAGFGWARPVPVNSFYFKKPRLAGVLVTVAGPLSNLILAALGIIIWYAFNLTSETSPNFYEFLNLFIELNAVLFVFNLLPFPPLDGYRIIEDLVPRGFRAKMTQVETYGAIIFLAIVIIPQLGEYTIQPIFNIVVPSLLNGLDHFFSQLFM